jgi:spermidine synthase
MGKGRTAFLLLTVFLSGTAVMVVEMTTVRVLQPTFGSTTYVWTNVIAVVLAALACGYAVGGRIADRRGTPPLLYGILAVGGLLVALAVPLASPVSRALLPLEVNLENVSSFLMKGSLVATLVLFAPATLLLGMVSPLAIRLLADAGVGRAAGRVFAVGTVGSIAGTYLPTLWLVPAFGSRATLLVAAGLLVIPAVVGLVLFAWPRGSVLALAAVAVTATTAAAAQTRPARGAPVLTDGGVSTVLEERESPYQYLSVCEDLYPGTAPVRRLSINEGVYTYHSVEVAGSLLTDRRYYDDYALLPVLLDLPEGEELRGCIVGLACGVTARQWKHFWDGVYDVRVTGAEIDPDIVDIGRRWFHLPAADATWMRSVVMDGRQMLAAMPAGETFHLLVVDAFSQDLYIPFHLGTKEFFELCRLHLAPGGIFAMNVYAYRADAPNLAAIENTVAHVFGNCRRVLQVWAGNWVLIARNGDEPADTMRFAPHRINGRFPDRHKVPEWDVLVGRAAWLPPHTALVTYDPAKPLLTDDDAPLEHMADRFVESMEEELLSR